MRNYSKAKDGAFFDLLKAVLAKEEYYSLVVVLTDNKITLDR